MPLSAHTNGESMTRDVLGGRVVGCSAQTADEPTALAPIAPDPTNVTDRSEPSCRTSQFIG